MITGTKLNGLASLGLISLIACSSAQAQGADGDVFNVKKLQAGMLVELRNLLTDEQMEYLREANGY
jgi:hypothetical protein